MSWWRGDDKLLHHRKWVGIRREAADRQPRPDVARQLTKDAKLAWFTTCIWGAGNNCDGIVPLHAAEQIAVLASLTEPEYIAAADVLVRCGLWHSLPKARGGPGWVIHDFTTYNPTRQQVEKGQDREKRRSDLYRTVEGRHLVAAIRERDGDHCRYCWTAVRWEDRRSAQGGTYDHVDPDGPNSLENLVVCCRSCNRAKAERTPEEAGITLRAPYWGDRIASDRDQVATKTRSKTRPDRTRGPGRVRSGQIGPDRGGAGAGADQIEAPSESTPTAAERRAAGGHDPADVDLERQRTGR